MININKALFDALNNESVMMCIVTVSENEYIHKGTRSSRVLIYVNIVHPVIGVLPDKIILSQYCKQGESPLIEGNKYVVTVQISPRFNSFYEMVEYELLECSDCHNEIAYYKKQLKIHNQSSNLSQ